MKIKAEKHNLRKVRTVRMLYLRQKRAGKMGNKYTTLDMLFMYIFAFNLNTHGQNLIRTRKHYFLIWVHMSSRPLVQSTTLI